jgi:hypothetical protein
MLFGRIALISGHPIYCPQPVLVTIWLNLGKLHLEGGIHRARNAPEI